MTTISRRGLLRVPSRWLGTETPRHRGTEALRHSSRPAVSHVGRKLRRLHMIGCSHITGIVSCMNSARHQKAIPQGGRVCSRSVNSCGMGWISSREGLSLAICLVQIRPRGALRLDYEPVPACSREGTDDGLQRMTGVGKGWWAWEEPTNRRYREGRADGSTEAQREEHRRPREYG
jgi:hypothetical protein